MVRTRPSWPGTSTRPRRRSPSRSSGAKPSSIVMPRAFSSGRRSVSTPVSARTSEVLPWSMWPAVPRTSRGPPGASTGGLAGADPVEARIGAERGRDHDRSVRALVVLEQGDRRARGRDRRPVQRVHELVALRVRAPEADAQAARLVVGAVRGARYLAVAPALAAARHPGLEVELPPRGSPEVAGRDLDHAVGDLERLEDPLLDREQLGVHRLRVLGASEREELDLRELVHAVEPPALAARRARLGAEAVRDPGHAHGELRLLEDPIRVVAAERDLRGPDQVEVGPGERVDLRLRAARAEGEAVDDGAARHVGGRVGGEARPRRHVEREALEREVEGDGLVHQEIELLARHARAGLEVEEAELLAEREVVEGREVEARRLAHAPELAEGVLAALGRLGVDQVRDGEEARLERGLGFGELLLERGELVLQAPALGGVRLALLGGELALARGLVLVAAAAELAERRLQARHALLRGDRAVELHPDAPAPAALLDLRAPARERAGVEHALPPQLVADRQVLHAADQARVQPLDGAGELDRLDPGQEVLIGHDELEPRQVRAEADVLAHAESEVAVRAAVDPELERRLEDLLVAVRGRVEERERVALADALAAQLVVRRRGAREVDDRRRPAHDLLDGGGQELRPALELAELARVLDEGEHAAARRVAGGLVPGDHDDQAPGEYVHLRQGLAVDPGLREERDQVVGRIALPLLDELREVQEELRHRLAPRLLARLALALVLRVRGADGAVGPVEEQVPVGLRDAEEPRDHRDRERRRDLLHEVALARVAPLDQPVDDLCCDRLDLAMPALERARREALGDELAVDPVLRRIHLDQAGREDLLDALLRLVADHEAPAVHEALGLLRDLDHVGLLRDRPEGDPLGLLPPVHRVLAPQARPDRVGIAVAGVVARVDEVEALGRLERYGHCCFLLRARERAGL